MWIRRASAALFLGLLLTAANSAFVPRGAEAGSHVFTVTGVQVDVTADNLPARRDRRCIRIDAAEAVQKPAMNGLLLKIAERTSPVMVGGKTTYEVFVKNVSDATLHDVTLTAIVPAEMTLGRETEAELQGIVATFAAVASLGPGQQIRYQVHVTAKQPGNARFVARLSARELSEPIEAAKVTLVFAER